MRSPKASVGAGERPAAGLAVDRHALGQCSFSFERAFPVLQLAALCLRSARRRAERPGQPPRRNRGLVSAAWGRWRRPPRRCSCLGGRAATASAKVGIATAVRGRCSAGRCSRPPANLHRRVLPAESTGASSTPDDVAWRYSRERSSLGRACPQDGGPSPSWRVRPRDQPPRRTPAAATIARAGLDEPGRAGQRHDSQTMGLWPGSPSTRIAGQGAVSSLTGGHCRRWSESGGRGG